jgi:hypothetical protein
MERDRDILAEALARLKQEGLSEDVPQTLMDETVRRLAEAEAGIEDGGGAGAFNNPGDRIWDRCAAVKLSIKLSLAAAAVLILGYTVGRLTAPTPIDPEELRAALAPSVAASLEPALRKKLSEEMRQQYQLALVDTYVRLKEELTAQYRDDLNRSAVQTLAASNAVTNELLADLIQAIDTAQAQDLRRIALVLDRIERNRVQDKTQLASGLQTLAYRTGDELSRTQRKIAQLLVDVRPGDFELPPVETRPTHDERNEP